MKKVNFLALAEQSVKIADDKKGENVVLLDVKKLTALADYFVIVTASSTPQINAIASEIEKKFKYDYDLPVLRRDGVSSAGWRVLDFGGLIIHIMNPEIREQYNLETIWTELKKSPAEKKIHAKKAGRVKKTAAKKTVKKVRIKNAACKKNRE